MIYSDTRSLLVANANGGTIASTSGWTGTGSTATKSVASGTQYGTLPTPTRTYYHFDGWYTEATGGTQVTDTTLYSGGQVEIFAHWSCAGLNSGTTYTVGSTVSYAGLNWTVVNDDGNNVGLAYNGKIDNNGSTTGTSGGSYTNATAAVNTWLHNNSGTDIALSGSCLVNNGSSANIKTNAPAAEHWLASGSVYVPSIKYQYSYGTTYYTYGYNAGSSVKAPVTGLHTSCSSSTRYAAGATASSIATSSTTMSYANDTCSSSTTSTYYNSNGATNFLLNGSASTCNQGPGTTNLDLDFWTYAYANNSTGHASTGTKDYWCTAKTMKAKICGSTNHGKFITWTAKSSTSFTYTNPAGTSSTPAYSSKYNYFMAGRANPTTTGTDYKDKVRTYDMTSTGCAKRTVKTISTSAAKPIYYRPYVSVVKK